MERHFEVLDQKRGVDLLDSGYLPQQLIPQLLIIENLVKWLGAAHFGREEHPHFQDSAAGSAEGAPREESRGNPQPSLAPQYQAGTATRRH